MLRHNDYVLGGRRERRSAGKTDRDHFEEGEVSVPSPPLLQSLLRSALGRRMYRRSPPSSSSSSTPSFLFLLGFIRVSLKWGRREGAYSKKKSLSSLLSFLPVIKIAPFLLLLLPPPAHFASSSSSSFLASSALFPLLFLLALLPRDLGVAVTR